MEHPSAYCEGKGLNLGKGNENGTEAFSCPVRPLILDLGEVAGSDIHTWDCIHNTLYFSLLVNGPDKQECYITLG
jgi:hypothetical protein